MEENIEPLNVKTILILLHWRTNSRKYLYVDEVLDQLLE